MKYCITDIFYVVSGRNIQVKFLRHRIGDMYEGNNTVARAGEDGIMGIKKDLILEWLTES